MDREDNMRERTYRGGFWVFHVFVEATGGFKFFFETLVGGCGVQRHSGVMAFEQEKG